MKNKFYPLIILLCIFCTNVQSEVHNVYSGNYYYTDANTGTSSSVVNVGDTVVWLRDAGFHNVDVEIADYSSPVRAAMEYGNKPEIFELFKDKLFRLVNLLISGGISPPN